MLPDLDMFCIKKKEVTTEITKTVREPRSRKILKFSAYHKLNFSGTKFLIAGIEAAYAEFRPVIYIGKMVKFGDSGFYFTKEEYETIFNYKNVTDDYFAGRESNFDSFIGKIIWQRSTWNNFKNLQKTVWALLYLHRQRSVDARSIYKKISTMIGTIGLHIISFIC